MPEPKMAKYERTVKKAARATRRVKTAITFLDSACSDLPIDSRVRMQLVQHRQHLEELVEELERT